MKNSAGRNSQTPCASRGPHLQELDAWENHWFPIAQASLLRRYPAVHARLFLNLSQTEGPEVAVSVGTFVERWEQLAAPDSPSGPAGRTATRLLGVRGIPAAVIELARALLAYLQATAPSPPPPSAEEQRADLKRAEDELWAWYLEWSQVAQAAVSQRVLLRRLGFLADDAATHGPAPATLQDSPDPTAPATGFPAQS